MYIDYYQLSAEPFRLTADPRFAFAHQSYSKARLTMQHALEQGEGLLVVTGRPGIGKTTLVEGFVAEMKSDAFTATLLSSSLLEGDDLLPRVAYAFGLDPKGMDKDSLLRKLKSLLNSHNSALLIIDEAQNLSSSALEELRVLASSRANSRPLLQIFLLGQLQLHERLHAPDMAPLFQSVTAECTLAPLSLQETQDYVLHRLNCADWHGNPVITTETFILIHRFSQGLPRYINAMCTRLFLHGAVEQKNRLDIDDFVTVLESIDSEKLLPATPDLQSGSRMRLPPIRELIRTKTLPLSKRLELTENEQAFIASNPAQTPPISIATAPTAPVAQTNATVPAKTSVTTPVRTADMAIPIVSKPAESASRRYIGYGAAVLALLAGSYLMGTHSTGPSPVSSEALAAATEPDAPGVMPTSGESVVTEFMPKIVTPVIVAEPQVVDLMPAAADRFPLKIEEPEVAAVLQDIHVEPANKKLLIPESDELAAQQHAMDRKIEQLLQLAQQAIARDYLRLSTKDSAWSYYQQVLELDPDNPGVGLGLQLIAARYGELTRAQIHRQQYEKAQQFIKRGLSVSPDDRQLLALQEEVDAAQAELFAQQQRGHLLALETEI